MKNGERVGARSPSPADRSRSGSVADRDVAVAAAQPDSGAALAHGQANLVRILLLGRLMYCVILC